MLADLWNAVSAAARTQAVLHGRAGEGRPAKPLAVVLAKRTLQAWTETLYSAKDVGWKRIAAEMGVGVGTIYRVALEGSKTQENVY
jgi:hypothetical protein